VASEIKDQRRVSKDLSSPKWLSSSYILHGKVNAMFCWKCQVYTFPFYYMTPSEHEKMIRKYYPEERGPVTYIHRIENSPVLKISLLHPMKVLFVRPMETNSRTIQSLRRAAAGRYARWKQYAREKVLADLDDVAGPFKFGELIG
jgi:hypothetical protein